MINYLCYRTHISKEDIILEKKQETFSSGIGLFFATLGSAVGLGNIWKFPYLTGANGGAAFLLIYLLCILFVGLPIMISEFYIGRKTRKNVVGAARELNPNILGKSIGCFSIVSVYLVLFFYTCVGGWVYSYVFRALKGDFTANSTVETTKTIFTKSVIGPYSPVIWQIIVLVVVSLILIAGVQKGIERIAKTLMPVLFIIIVLCDIRALTLPGAKEGLRFLFKPDFSSLTTSSILTALGLAFFKLSVGMGTMVTYGSYFTKDNDLISTSFRVALSDTLVSMLCGIAIFPAVFSFGVKPGDGPGLLFTTIPLVFSKIPFGNVLLVLFFILASIAATTAMMSMLEVPVAFLTGEKNFTRKKAVIVNMVILIILGSLASLSADNASLLGGIKVFGRRFFDLFDYVSSNILLPLLGLLICGLMGYKTKKQDIVNELSNEGNLKNIKLINMYYIIIKYIAPLLLLVIFLNSLGIIKF